MDLVFLENWLDSRDLGSGPLEDMTEVTGGTQNVMLRFRRGSDEFVLRRGPVHLRAQTNKSLKREVRILGALTGSAVPHPRLIAASGDDERLAGSVFYVMEAIDGINASHSLSDTHAHDPQVRHRMGVELIDRLVDLHETDHTAIGLDGFGRPDGFLERQVSRWSRELDGYTALAGYPRPQLPGFAKIADWLGTNCPSPSRPGILHGDYHLGNVMFSHDSPSIVAVVDWEMSTIGDPLLDLGWVLATSEIDRDVPDIFGSAISVAGGLPTRAEMTARYRERGSRDLHALDWYVVLAHFKLGIVIEGTYARSLSGLARPEVGESLHQSAVRLFERSQTLM